jgi:hypothetical protein
MLHLFLFTTFQKHQIAVAFRDNNLMSLESLSFGYYTLLADISEKRLVSGPSSPRQEALNVDAVRSSKVSVTANQSTRHNIPLNVNLYWQPCEILKLTIVIFCFRELSIIGLPEAKL